jgi:hypothetical protein
MGGVMRSTIVLILILISAIVLSTPVLESVEVTPENSAELGFSLNDIGSGNPQAMLVKLDFPATIEDGKRAKRVQTYLLDSSGKELSSSSADYSVESKSPSLLAHFNPAAHDMALVIQYFCSNIGSVSCAKSYTISSVKNYLITRPVN